MNSVILTGRLKAAPREAEVGSNTRIKQVTVELMTAKPPRKEGGNKEEVFVINFFGDSKCGFIMRRKFKAGDAVTVYAKLYNNFSGALSISAQDMTSFVLPTVRKKEAEKVVEDDPYAEEDCAPPF